MLRTTAAVVAGKAARAVSRLRGGGSALPGLVAERVDPGFLAHALADVPRGIVVVSGTNGKTTTTKMLVAVLRAHGLSVFTNPTGSNFTRGVISSMLGELPVNGRLKADMAVLELDEAHALRFAAAVRPTHALLLNVARDQLDRFAEIDHTAQLLASLAEQTTAGVVLNIDDSFISRIRDRVADGVPVRYFGVDASIADRLPELQEQDVRFDDDFRPPQAGPDDGLLKPHDERSFEVLFGADGTDDHVGPLELQQRGLAAMINATAATTTAKMLLGTDFDPVRAQAALRSVTPPFGRGVAMTSGVRAYDMALRLQYDDVPVDQIEPDLDTALDAFLAAHPEEPKRIFCTYTAMMSLRRVLAARYDLPDIGEEAQ